VEAVEVKAAVLRGVVVAAKVLPLLPPHPQDLLSPRRLLAKHIRGLHYLLLVLRALLRAYSLQRLLPRALRWLGAAPRELPTITEEVTRLIHVPGGYCLCMLRRRVQITIILMLGVVGKIDSQFDCNFW
jgi:hypothetical protein